MWHLTMSVWKESNLCQKQMCDPYVAYHFSFVFDLTSALAG